MHILELAINSLTTPTSTVCSVLFRLYWYPTKVIYSAVYVGPTVFKGGPWFLVFLPMLWGLYAMQVGVAGGCGLGILLFIITRRRLLLFHLMLSIHCVGWNL